MFQALSFHALPGLLPFISKEEKLGVILSLSSDEEMETRGG